VKKTAEEMMKILFSLKETDMHVFYRKVLRNIWDFWQGTDMEKVRDMYA